MIDIIGRLYQTAVLPAEWTLDDPVASPPAVWGFHVNATPGLLVTHPDLEAKVIKPAVMRRVFAGDDPDSPTLTVPLRFNGENAAREALGDLWPAEPA